MLFRSEAPENYGNRINRNTRDLTLLVFDKERLQLRLNRSVETVYFPFKINVSTLHRESAMPSSVTSGNMFLSEYSKTLMFALYFTCTNYKLI